MPTCHTFEKELFQMNSGAITDYSCTLLCSTHCTSLLKIIPHLDVSPVNQWTIDKIKRSYENASLNKNPLLN